MSSLKNLFQISTLPMWVSDATTLDFLAVNNEVTRQFGYTEAELMNMSITDIQSNEAHGRNIGILTKAGRTIFIRIESSTVEYEGRSANFVTAIDVTTEVNNLKLCELNTERYHIISKATSDTIWDWNLQTEEIVWNRGIKGIFGYKDLVEDTTSVQWWQSRIHPDDRSRIVDNINLHILNGISRWQEEYRFACEDGSYRHVHDRGFMVFDNEGVSIRMIGSMQDISQRKQEEQWSRLLESVVINATDAVLICSGNLEDNEQEIIYVNEAFTKMSGYSKDELIGSSPSISQGPATDLKEIRKLKEAIKNKVPCEIEVINYTRLGKQYWVSQSSSPISNADGEVTHWISIQRDITQNRKHLQEIEDQNKKFREIAWIQSHIVRAPLARVMALVDLLSNFTPGDDKDELLLHLTNSAKELDTIIINIADKTP